MSEKKPVILIIFFIIDKGIKFHGANILQQSIMYMYTSAFHWDFKFIVNANSFKDWVGGAWMCEIKPVLWVASMFHYS